MADDDIKLSRLLATWKGVEPDTGFEVAVWRKVRAVSAPAREPSADSISILAILMNRPLWRNTAAAFLGVIVGLSAGIVQKLGSSDITIHAGRSHSGALSGAYISMLRGGPR